MSEGNIQDLIYNLNHLVTQCGEGSFLIVTCDEAYMQFAAGTTRGEIYCEAVSNEFLPDDARLSPEKVDVLKKMGFVDPENSHFSGSSPNFSCLLKIRDNDDVSKVAGWTVEVMREAYGKTGRFDFQLDS